MVTFTILFLAALNVVLLAAVWVLMGVNRQLSHANDRLAESLVTSCAQQIDAEMSQTGYRRDAYASYGTDRSHPAPPPMPPADRNPGLELG